MSKPSVSLFLDLNLNEQLVELSSKGRRDRAGEGLINFGKFPVAQVTVVGRGPDRFIGKGHAQCVISPPP